MTSAIRSHATLARLYVSEDLSVDAKIDLPHSQAHYLSKVMRLKVGAHIRVFQDRDGEWLAQIDEIGKRHAKITIVKNLRPSISTPDVWVLFSPVKKSRNDFIVEKATELGAAVVQPVHTKRTSFPNIKTDRMWSQAVEAAEQTERMDVPMIVDPIKLTDLLLRWDKRRTLIFADEAGGGKAAISALREIKAPCAILIGPEGGFDTSERDLLLSLEFVIPINLGPRILRADTAVAATLALWQAASGDWE